MSWHFWRGVWQSIVRRYRLLWMEESGTFRWEVRLPGWGWGLILLVIGGIMWVFFAYTPLRHTIPGYPTQRFYKAYRELLERTQQVERRVQQHLLLIEDLRKLQASMRSEPSGGSLPLVPTLQSGQYVLPVEGQVVRRMQASQAHWGVDIACEAGVPVLAMAEGTIIFAEYSYQTGYVIALQHPNGLVSFYKHNSRLLREVGEKVQAGDVIALAGGLGVYSTGPHLHIETWLGGLPVDPLKLLAYER